MYVHYVSIHTFLVLSRRRQLFSCIETFTSTQKPIARFAPKVFLHYFHYATNCWFTWWQQQKEARASKRKSSTRPVCQ